MTTKYSLYYADMVPDSDGDYYAVSDVDALIADLERDAARYRFMRDEDNWGEDSGDDCWANLAEAHGEWFDEIIDGRIAKHKRGE